MWDLEADDPNETSLVLRAHNGIIRSVAISPDARWVVTASDYNDETVRLWDLQIDSALDRARRLAGRELTPDERKQYMVENSTN